MEMARTVGAVDALKVATDTGLDLLEKTQHADTRTALNAMLRRIGHANSVIASLQKENQELRQELRDRDTWEARSARYRLTRTVGGAYVYEPTDQVEPHHYCCPNCFEESRIRILQDQRSLSGNYRCPHCQTNYPVEEIQPGSSLVHNR